MEWLRLILAGGAVLLLPGAGLRVWLRPRAEGAPFSWSAFLADCAGLSISLSAILALFFYLAGIQPGLPGLVVLLVVSSLSILAAFLTKQAANFALPGWGWVGVGCVLTVGLVALRLQQTAGLAFPAWVDSVHHTYIVQIFREVGGIPVTLPLVPAVDFHYHYGFHLLAAEFATLANLQSTDALLWIGPALYVALLWGMVGLGRALGLERRAAWLAGIFSQFVLFMPAYYISWGRYTLLTGLVVLLPALTALLKIHQARAQGRSADLRQSIQLALLVAGLCLSHYFALLLFFLFLFVLLAGEVWLVWRSGTQFAGLGSLAAVGVGLGLGLPWLIPMLLANTPAVRMTAPQGIASLAAGWQGLRDLLQPEISLWMMGLSAFTLVLAFWRVNLRLFAVWGFILVFFSLPIAPRLGPFRPDHFIIILFIPASILLGWVLDEGITQLMHRLQPAMPRRAWLELGIWAALCAGLLAWGFRESRYLINPATLFADQTDRRALDWIRLHTAPDASFLINSKPWMAGVRSGIDGGYWILPYAGRMTFIPPVVYTWLPQPELERINRLAEEVQTVQGCTPEFAKVLAATGAGYVYARSDRGGSLDPLWLSGCALLEPVYQDGPVGIFKVLQPQP